jgi:steroid 5-alpha reductase family enzyme
MEIVVVFAALLLSAWAVSRLLVIPGVDWPVRQGLNVYSETADQSERDRYKRLYRNRGLIGAVVAFPVVLFISIALT